MISKKDHKIEGRRIKSEALAAASRKNNLDSRNTGVGRGRGTRA
jgi:hypothetical protein